MIGIILSLLTPQAHAFCGTFVGGADATLFNEVAQVAVVRSGNQSILTLANDVQGNFDSFALVLPVPEVLDEDDLKVLEPALFDRLYEYSQPRLVEYTCDDFHNPPPSADGGNSFNESEDPTAGSGVDIEAQYIVGEYDIVILSATQSQGLFDWLNQNGYQVPGQSIDLLQEYIDSGSFFLAAKVDSSAEIAAGDMLSPLQLKYNTAVFQIPIRIGTLNAKETQDLIVYAINDYSQGAVGISNYAEFQVEDECMWESEGETFGEFYAQKFRIAYEETNEGAWTTEYAWGGGGCDPCTGTPPDGTDLLSLGVEEELIHYSDYFFTRLHMRYTPDQADEEVMLYNSNLYDQQQIRYIDYLYELEDSLPVCGLGMVDDPGTCSDTEEPSSEPTAEPTEEGSEEDPSAASSCSGCASGGEPIGLIWLFGLLFSRRRQHR